MQKIQLVDTLNNIVSAMNVIHKVILISQNFYRLQWRKSSYHLAYTS